MPVGGSFYTPPQGVVLATYVYVNGLGGTLLNSTYSNILVRAESFRVFAANSLARSYAGRNIQLTTRGVTVEIRRGLLGRESIVIRDGKSGDVRISISNKRQLPSIWDALIETGAVAVGPPPNRSRRTHLASPRSGRHSVKVQDGSDGDPTRWQACGGRCSAGL
jgi:hypothetical protein